MLMHNPPYPGEVLRELCLEPLDLSVTAASKALGVSRKTLSVVLNGKAGISPEMAIQLSIAFGTSAESWLNQQSQYELWHAEQYRKRLNVKKLVAARSIIHVGRRRLGGLSDQDRWSITLPLQATLYQ
jgi:addiction module HigA family antidote